MIELKPMTDASYQVFFNALVPDYASEKVRSGEWSAQDALQRARDELSTLLPQGRATPQHFLYDLHDPALGAEIGVLWFALRGPEGRRKAWVYEVRVFPEHQRRGYASQAFESLRREAAALGADSVQLHVFGHNAGARALYEKLGFIETNVIMRLDLPH